MTRLPGLIAEKDKPDSVAGVVENVGLQGLNGVVVGKVIPRREVNHCR